jgi:cytochrome c oxidase subunit 2
LSRFSKKVSNSSGRIWKLHIFGEKQVEKSATRCERAEGSMTKSAYSYILRTLALLGLVAFCLPSGRISAQNQNIQVIEVTAKKYEYSPEPIHVKRDTKVQLKITATDHDHGFKIVAFPDGAAQGGTLGLVFASAQDCWQLKKGETTTIEFLAQTPGTYTFRCCHTCGVGHRGMKGEVVVDQ